MGKQGKRQRDHSDQEEVQDVMAWGARKDNYYQHSESEYSQLEEEEEEAKQIYQHHITQLQNDDIYDLPQQHSEHESIDDTQEAHLSQEYLQAEVRRMIGLGRRVSSQAPSKAKTLLEEYIQAYLMTLIALKQLKIDYVEYHPILAHTASLKQHISQLTALTLNQNEDQEPQEEDHSQEGEQNRSQYEDQQQEEEIQQESENEDKSEEDQLQQGLQLYEQAKTKQQELKKQKKAASKQQRQNSRKPAFVQVGDKEGRLANQKILKNKGLLKKRKKIDRNGRVKLRRKFDKASSKRRAYGHVVRQDPGRWYDGDRNIKIGRIASTKIK